MKKLYFIIIITICIIVFVIIFYLGRYSYDNKYNAKLIIENSVDVMISIQNEILLNSTENIILNIKNINVDKIEFGLDYEIQIKNKNTWLRYYKPEIIDSPIISLIKGNSYKQKIYFDNKINFKTNKKYRILKVINEKVYVSNEFIFK